ncbi:ABC transporter ATP-binding protein [Chitinophaga sancti]|uniref:ABC transporter ATP-binding protein n=1 Tax=Chitinophaga sancti TaxID=1004 RepID=A0A1K1SHS2_9BACT|nr:ABC transporter ATP-binding protein [Chitinophaga sancti]WQD61812.1 ABC transporter ATP-binding protein [Chitinophaga sancti]WQG92619.1 ABC transporter ATP-binding protein [Chitinophaga sancti]SFW83870.1 iron(III) transport system ATP-binding protein [Chitinophaga sancti]
MSFLTVTGIRTQVNGEWVLKGIDFSQQKHQQIAIVGASGSGKSTLLKVIGGLMQTDEGEVRFEGQRVKGPHERLLPGEPGIAYLSQHYELRLNYRVEQVLEYANKMTDDEADELYRICRIDHLMKRKTDQLSGGEKQRVAMARLLIGNPSLFLLDEPFSNLDYSHKQILKTVLSEIGEKLDLTCLLVSHDPQDTLSWADEILVVKDGWIVQKGTPVDVYNHPVDEYTAALFGPYNLVDAKVLELESEKKVFVRPENLYFGYKAGIKGLVEEVNYMGSAYEIRVKLPGGAVLVRAVDITPLPKKGNTVYIAIKPDSIWHL